MPTRRPAVSLLPTQIYGHSELCRRVLSLLADSGVRGAVLCRPAKTASNYMKDVFPFQSTTPRSV